MCPKKSNLSAAIPSRKCYLLRNIETNSPICNKLVDKTSFSHWVGCGVNSLNRLRRHLAARWLGGLVGKENLTVSNPDLLILCRHGTLTSGLTAVKRKEFAKKKKERKNTSKERLSFLLFKG